MKQDLSKNKQQAEEKSDIQTQEEDLEHYNYFGATTDIAMVKFSSKKNADTPKNTNVKDNTEKKTSKNDPDKNIVDKKLDIDEFLRRKKEQNQKSQRESKEQAVQQTETKAEEQSSQQTKPANQGSFPNSPFAKDNAHKINGSNQHGNINHNAFKPQLSGEIELRNPVITKSSKIDFKTTPNNNTHKTAKVIRTQNIQDLSDKVNIPVAATEAEQQKNTGKVVKIKNKLESEQPQESNHFTRQTNNSSSNSVIEFGAPMQNNKKVSQLSSPMETNPNDRIRQNSKIINNPKIDDPLYMDPMKFVNLANNNDEYNVKPHSIMGDNLSSMKQDLLTLVLMALLAIGIYSFYQQFLQDPEGEIVTVKTDSSQINVAPAIANNQKVIIPDISTDNNIAGSGVNSSNTIQPAGISQSNMSNNNIAVSIPKLPNQKQVINEQAAIDILTSE